MERGGERELMLERESDEGNVEYKLKLLRPSRTRFTQLVTQLKYRLEEGGGEAIYELGVCDNGHAKGLAASEAEGSLSTLRDMCEQLGVRMNVMRTRQLAHNGRQVVEVLVRQLADSSRKIEVRCAVLGEWQAGKSTLIGVLSHGMLDDGAGSARAGVLRHVHELETGCTSSVSTRVVGFDADGRALRARPLADAPEEVVGAAVKLVTLVDLCGSDKYFKTTVSGLTAQAPDYAAVVVGADEGVTRTTVAHEAIARALCVGVFYVVSKADAGLDAVERATRQLQELLVVPGSRRVPLRVHSRDDASLAARALGAGEPIAPLFALSSVSGEGMELLRHFLNLLPAAPHWDARRGAPALFAIDNVFSTAPAPAAAAAPSALAAAPPGQRSANAAAEHAAAEPAAAAVHVRRTHSSSSSNSGGRECRRGSRPKSNRARRARGVGLFGDEDEDEDAWGFTAGGAAGGGGGSLLDALPLAGESGAGGAPPSGSGRSDDASDLAAVRNIRTSSSVSSDVIVGAPTHTHGAIVTGTLMQGTVRLAEPRCARAGPRSRMLLGPDAEGRFLPVKLSSIHYKQLAVDRVSAGHTASLHLLPPERLAPRRGMVLVDASLRPCACKQFDAVCARAAHAAERARLVPVARRAGRSPAHAPALTAPFRPLRLRHPAVHVRARAPGAAGAAAVHAALDCRRRAACAAHAHAQAGGARARGRRRRPRPGRDGHRALRVPVRARIRLAWRAAGLLVDLGRWRGRGQRGA